jgi:predicted metal-binding membrane protein
MLALSVVIWLERVASFGDWLTRVTGAVLVILGVVLLVHPALVINLV